MGESIMDETKWEIVHSESGMAKANIVAGRLESEGIPTKLKYEAVGAIYAITVDGLGQIDILVPAEHVESAREILCRSYSEADMGWDIPG
jgi:hypothetical protein